MKCRTLHENPKVIVTLAIQGQIDTHCKGGFYG